MLFYSICFLAMFARLDAKWQDKSIERRLLNDGNWMPTACFGTYIEDLNDRPRVRKSVIDAIEAGYRCIDTAFGYLTEDMVGEAIADVIRRGVVKRTDMFVNSKLSLQVGSCDEVVPAIKKALKRMKTDYVDLFLIHTPRNVLGIENYDTFEIWRGLEEAKRLGLTRSIGVSNFNSTDMARILASSKTLPAVNQIETNPTFANQELVAYCQSKSIVVMGYSSLGFLVPRPFNDLALPPSFEDPTLVRLAEKYGVAVSQIVLRYLVDRYITPITGSLNKEHIQSNINIYDFTLCHEDILIINEFDRNVKVYLIDYDGLFEFMYLGMIKLIEFVECNNLRQYELRS